MRILLITFLVLVSITAGIAQVDRSTYPAPGPAPEIKLGTAHDFTLSNGLKVFVVENRKLPRVAFSLVLERDPIAEKEKNGMLGMVGDMMMGGTQNRTKDQLDDEIDFIGASLSASSTSIYASSLKKHQEKVLELMADVLFNPTFPEAELDKLKKQAKSAIAAGKDEPNAISQRIVSVVNFGADHPYGEVTTEENIDNITLDDIKNYYTTFYKPNVAYLAIVGDIDKKEAESLVKKHFSKWKKGEIPSFSYNQPTPPEKNQVALVDRPASVQSVVNLTYPLEMNLSHPDYLTTRLLGYILGGGSSSRLFMNLREDKGYTYGAYASIGADKLIASFSARASVKQTATDSAIQEMIYEISNIVENGVTEEELEAAKAYLSGSFGRSLERPNTIANFAINTERYKLPADFYTTYLQKLNAVTVAEVNAAAAKFLKPGNLNITVVGNAGEIEASLAPFGEIKRYTNMAAPEKEMKMADASITAQAVIDAYLEAMGGKSKLTAINNAKIESSAEIQGMTLNLLTVHDESKEIFSQKVMMMGNVASHTLIKDGTASVKAMGQSQQLSDDKFESAKLSMNIFPELTYEKLGYNLQLDGIKEIDGQEAYRIEITTKGGAKVVNYYAVSNGFKLKTESADAGEITYTEYEKVDEVMFPMKMTIASPMMPMALETKVDKIAFNIEISAADIE